VAIRYQALHIFFSWLEEEEEIVNNPMRKTHQPYNLLDKGCKQAGLLHIHPHLFRHTYAYMFLEAGGQEGDLMLLGGWASREIMSRYGKSGAEKRARENYRSLSPGDRI
jgi:integrase